LRTIRVLSLDFTRELDSAFDVAVLGLLVTTTEQNKDPVAATREIDAIAGPVVDPHLGHTASNRLRVARIAERKTANARRDTRTRLTVAQISKPVGKDVGLPDLYLST
jgi:hypothetical protein